MINFEIARRLDEVADLLSEQGANRFRIQAYQHAADTLRRLPRSLREIVHEEGIEGLHKLPGIGDSLARSIQTLVTTGRLPLLERLRGETDGVALLASVPGIGKVLARRRHHDLGIDTLEDLEPSAYNGRFANLAGIGPKRLAAITAICPLRDRATWVPIKRLGVSPVRHLPICREMWRPRATG